MSHALAVGAAEVPVTAMLVLIDTDRPPFGGDFTTNGTKILWPKKATELILEPGSRVQDQVIALHRELAAAFPSA